MVAKYEAIREAAKSVQEITSGEYVDVYTKMGNRISGGNVRIVTPNGVVLNEGGFYSDSMHLFCGDKRIVVQKQYDEHGDLCLPSDRSLAGKLHDMAESNLVFEVEKLDPNDNSKPEDGDDDSDVGMDDSNDKKKQAKDDKQKSRKDDKDNTPLADPNTSVDVDSLPDDVKKAVISTIQMDEEQLNGVLSEMGDALMKALKRVNIREPDIYAVVGDIQNSAYDIMTTKKSAKGK